jgi:hypothetical protein
MSTTTPVQKSWANSIKLFSTLQTFGQNKLERLPQFILSGDSIICDWYNKSIEGSQLEWSTVLTFLDIRKKLARCKRSSLFFQGMGRGEKGL